MPTLHFAGPRNFEVKSLLGKIGTYSGRNESNYRHLIRAKRLNIWWKPLSSNLDILSGNANFVNNDKDNDIQKNESS